LPNTKIINALCSYGAESHVSLTRERR